MWLLLVSEARKPLTQGIPASRYILIGPTPPPFGGVSVYVSRLSKKLRAEGHQVSIVNPSALRGVRKLLALARLVFDPRETSIQLHAFDFSAMAAMIVRPFRKKLQYMDHNTAIYQRDLGRIRHYLFARVLQNSDEIVFVSQKAIDYYRGKGFKIAPHVQVRSPFLPPSLEDEGRIVATYSADTKTFVETHSPLLIANASAILFYGDVELYGLDMCVDLVAGLKPDFPRIGMVFAIADATINADYIETVQRRIVEAGIQDNFHFLTGQRELWPLFRVADLMLRPTSDDGYGISLAEAISFDCAALASDVTGRPNGTSVFPSRNADAFHERAVALLRSRKLKKGVPT